MGSLQLSPKIRSAIAAEGKAHFPLEACGLILRIEKSLQLLPCKNVAGERWGEDMFVLDSSTFASASLRGDIVAIYHTHPHTNASPSDADRIGCRESAYPWVVCQPFSEEFAIIYPSDDLPFVPLLGRQFTWGVFDCYSLVSEFYKQEWGIQLGHVDRGLLFEWDSNPAWNRFDEFFRLLGFMEIPSATQRGDVFLMSVGSRTINHCGFLVEPSRNIFYHHLLDHLSEAAVYGEEWAKRTRKIVRHRDVPSY